MKKKILSLLLATLMIVGLFSGCGGGGSDGGDSSGEVYVDADGVEHAPVTITYMRQEAINDATEREMIAEFEKLYPWITVEIQSVPAMETYNKLLLTTQSGNPPDVFWNFWTAGAAANGLLEDLGPYVDDAYLEDFNDAMLGICELDGVLYGLPWRSSSNIYMVNKNVVKAAGLEMPDDENWDWDEFKEFIAALRDAGNDVYGLGFDGASADTGTDWQFMPWLLSAGGHIMNEENTRAVFNSPEGVEALTFLCDLIKEDLVPPGITSTTSSILEEMQASNKLGMWQDGIWMLTSMMQSYPDVEFAALKLPKGRTGLSGNIAGGTCISMAAKSDNKEEAWLFIEFMCSQENMLRWATGTASLSGRESNWTDEYYQDDHWQVSISQLRDCDNLFPANAYYDNETLNQILREYLGAAYIGEMTPQAALDAAAAEWNAILEEHYPD